MLRIKRELSHHIIVFVFTTVLSVLLSCAIIPYNT